MDYDTMIVLVSERRATLRHDGEQVRRTRSSRWRRTARRSHANPPVDTR